jgi:hypothetical protein
MAVDPGWQFVVPSLVMSLGGQRPRGLFEITICDLKSEAPGYNLRRMKPSQKAKRRIGFTHGKKRE